jgi:hypothetical protein
MLLVETNVLGHACPVVLVPPTQEALVLFFKTLIKRIKIDINMTKLQVLGEYYEYIEVRYSEFV